jgi:hypothetical protein
MGLRLLPIRSRDRNHFEPSNFEYFKHLKRSFESYVCFVLVVKYIARVGPPDANDGVPATGPDRRALMRVDPSEPVYRAADRRRPTEASLGGDRGTRA